MDNEFMDALIARLRALLPGLVIADAGVFSSSGPSQGQVWVAVSYDQGASLGRLLSVAVDIDIWTKGPDSSAADSIAAQIENNLLGETIQSVYQGDVRLHYFSRAVVAEPEGRLAHVTMRFTGRAYRRL